MRTTLHKTGRPIHLLESTKSSEATQKNTKSKVLLFLLLMVSLFCASDSFGQILNTGLKNPSSNTGATTGVNPANAYSSNDVYATFDANGETARWGGFGLGLSGNITVLGIGVRVEGKGDEIADRNVDFALSWNNGTNFTTVKALPKQYTSDGISIMGGLGDTWGHAWTAAELSDANFSVRATVTNAATTDVLLDHIQIIVYYATTYTATFLTTNTFSTPAGVNNVTVEAWGAGAGGSSGTAAAGAGGGGAYTKGTISGLTTGNSVSVTVGTGGAVGAPTVAPGNFSRASFGATTITANGGLSTTASRTGGAGGTASTVGGAITASFAGGTGGNARAVTTSTGNEQGGGGGGSALQTAAGTTGSNGAGDTNDITVGGLGTGYGGGGAAGDGAPNAQAGYFPGGGGGGRGEGTSTSQAGANGIVVLTWCPTFSVSATSAASPICVSSPSTLVTLTASPTGGLPAGTYTVTYNRSSPSATGLTATLTVGVEGTGTFTAVGLTTAGSATITVTNIAVTTNSCNTNISTGNVSNTITVNAIPTANPGNAVSVCYTSGAITVNPDASASVTNASSVLWSGGAGTWADATSLTLATYTPTPSEIVAGSVVITLTATGNSPCGNASNNKTVTIKSPITANAGADQNICSTSTATLAANSASPGTGAWTILTGPNTSTAQLSSISSPTAVFTPTSAGPYTLRWTITNAPCTPNSDDVVVVVDPAATVNAGADQPLVCATSPVVSLAGTRGGGATSSTWSGGTGTFGDASLLNTTYTPSAGEIAAGGNITLTLTTDNPAGPCGVVSDSMIVTINLPATANAGPDQEMCSSTPTVNITGVRGGTGVNSSTWSSSSGNVGGFGNVNSLSTTYAPSATDIANGTVTLTFTTNDPASFCNAASDTMVITIYPAAIVNAGVDMSACSTQPITLAGTMGGAASSVTWSAPSGTFSNVNSLTSTYTPSVASGPVVLTLTSNDPTGPCGVVTDQMTVNVNAVPQTAGVIICQGTASQPMTSLLACTAGAPVASTKFPTSGVNSGTGTAWGQPESVVSDNNVGATIAGTALQTVTSQALNATNYGFAIPANATIQGIQCSIARSRNNPGLSGGSVQDVSLRLLKAGTAGGTNLADTVTAWGTTETVANYGGATQLWGNTWTPADINASNFGVSFSASVITGFAVARTGNVDYIQLTVSYTLPGSLNWYTASSGGTLLGSGTSFNPVGVAGSGLPDTNTPGSYTFYAECSTVVGCRTATNYVINPLPTVSFTTDALAPMAALYCNDAIVNLVGTPAGGTFSGAGITNTGSGTATFNAATAGVGPHSIVYSYTDGNTCLNTSTQNTTVNANVTYYADLDGDNFGDPANSLVSCTGPQGIFTLTDNSDCNDALILYQDNDADGFGSNVKVPCVGVTNNTDCNDAITYYTDADGDGFGVLPKLACGTVTNNTDCDDAVIYYTDADGDGFGVLPMLACGTVTNNTDCNDAVIYYTDADGDGFGVLPMLACGSVTNNTDCNDAVIYYTDADGDGFGALPMIACGTVTNNTDCNDALLLYTDVDGDGFGSDTFAACTGVTNTDDCNDAQLLYTDVDGDGFGSDIFAACTGVANTDDCNDAQLLYTDVDGDGFGSDTFAACTGVTNTDDCDDNVTRYADADGDGYGTLVKVACGGSTNSTDCDDTKASVHPGATEIGYNLIDDDCDGLTDEGFPPKTTTITGVQCSTTLPAIDTQLYADNVPGAQGYRWRITTMSGPNNGQVQFLDTTLRVMKITQLGNYAFNTSYKVELAVYYAGFLQPYTTSNCTVSTPDTTTKLTSCGQTLTAMTNVIYANIVPFAAGYRFKITDPLNGSNTQTIERPVREFRMNLINAFTVQYGKAYNVEVSVKNTDGSWLSFGQVCSVTTPIFPTTSLEDATCEDYLVPTYSTQIYAISAPAAIAYVFKLTGPGLPVGGAEVTKSLRAFTLGDFTGLIPSATYNVQVKLIFNMSDAPGPYGKTCTVVAPGLSRPVAPTYVNFNAVAYPNPFAESFSINVTTSTDEKVSVKVYDMTGKLLENKEVGASEIKSLQIGDRFPAGVYNVIVNQGAEVKTLRVIKR